MTRAERIVLSVCLMVVLCHLFTCITVVVAVRQFQGLELNKGLDLDIEAGA